MTILAVAVAVVLMGAAVAKFADLEAFAATLEGVAWVPNQASPLLAKFIPALELVLAVGLLIDALRVGAAVAVIVLLALFTVHVSVLRATGASVGCGCFGGSPNSRVRVVDIVRNLILLGASVAVAVVGTDHALTLVGLIAGSSLGCAMLIALTAESTFRSNWLVAGQS